MAVVLLVPEAAVTSTGNDVDAIDNDNITNKTNYIIRTCGCGVTGSH